MLAMTGRMHRNLDADLDVAQVSGDFTFVTSCFVVQLPGIEPVAEMALTCGNVETANAKVRETTWGYAKGVDDVNARSDASDKSCVGLGLVAAQ
jgi:hypothetical protein